MATIDEARALDARGRTTWHWRSMVAATSGIVLLVVGLAVLAMLPWDAVRLHRAAQSWPQSTASLDAVALLEVPEVDAAGAIKWRLVLTVDYGYEIDGVAHRGRRASLVDEGDRDDRRLKALYSRLKFAQVTGRQATVAYDPLDPGRAYLDTAFDWSAGLLRAGTAASLCLIGLIFLIAPGRRTAGR